MRGFFSKETLNDPCRVCELKNGCKSPKMELTGYGEKQILVIGEGPGEQEDRTGVQLIGPAGQFFREVLAENGMELDRDFWKTNAVNCRPPENRAPSKKEMKACRPRILSSIRKLKPKFIWLLGGSAVESFYMDLQFDCSISLWRKRCIPDYECQAYVIPLYHPAYVLHNREASLEQVFRDDVKWAISCLPRSKPSFPDYRKQVRIVSDDELSAALENLLSRKLPLSIDYETSGLNPYKIPDPTIFTIAISDGVDSYSFALTEKTRAIFEKVLVDKNVHKVAHNVKFEEKWTRVVFGVKTKGWVWDTMIAQHVLDGRSKSTGLKFQVFVRYGEKGYGKEVDVSKLTMTSPALLLYNGLDALFTGKLYLDQKAEFGRLKGLSTANQLFFDGTAAFCDLEENGISISKEYFEKQDLRLEKRIERMKSKLDNGVEASDFKRTFGKPLDLGSPKDLRSLFFNLLKVPVGKKTTVGFASVDQEVLESLSIPFAMDLVKYRKLLKIRNTYFGQFIRELCPDGKIHPSFNLNLVKTYRSSSDSPNFQNIPVRDEESKKIIRSGIFPSQGNRLLEVDYGSLEVRIMACYTKDPVLIDYLVSGGDMHRDEAKHTFLFLDEEWDQLDKSLAKDLRFYSKNMKVFPYFYGSYYKSCAWDLWGVSGELKIRNHLRGKRIRDYDDFLEYMIEDEKRFWTKFRVFREWQNGVEESYISRGYIEYFTGFRVGGFLSHNELLNYRIQGTAFHCLLWSLIKLNNRIKKERLRTKIIGQIHDSIVFDLHPDETYLILQLCQEVMTEDIRKEWDWIIVPLEVEFEVTEIDQPWYYKKEVKWDGPSAITSKISAN